MNQRVKQVLIIDDNKTFVMYVGLLLRRLGVEVIAAENALEGLKRLKTDPPDAVLLDLVMPDMDGIEILRFIRSDEKLAHLPVVMVSVDGSETTMKMCRQQGASGYLTKPVRINHLNAALYEVLQYPGGNRKNLRVSLNERLHVRWLDKSEELFATVLSEGGIYLRTQEPLPQRTTMEIALPLGDMTTLTLKGEVIYQRGVYQKSTWGDPGVAVRFQELSPAQTTQLREFISYRLAGDLVEEQEHTVICFDDLSVDEKKKLA